MKKRKKFDRFELVSALDKSEYFTNPNIQGIRTGEDLLYSDITVRPH